MSKLLSFDKKEIDLTNNTLEEAVSLIRNYYHFDFSEWKEIKYDLRTLEELSSHEITNRAFAELFLDGANRKVHGLLPVVRVLAGPPALTLHDHSP